MKVLPVQKVEQNADKIKSAGNNPFPSRKILATLHSLNYGMISIEKIKQLSKDMKEEVIAIRRHLHAHPELSFQEKETSAYISARLTAWNIEHLKGIAGTGIVALIKGKNPDKKVIALRADMDALPITEKNEVDYRSQNIGVMHACGHDVHSSSLLGTAKMLAELRDEFEGTIKLIFQPGEEKLPGGASLMIKEGVLENPVPEFILAQHVFTQLPVGKAGFFAGKYMASSDEIYISVKGKGGHAAVPSGVINPLYPAARLLTLLEDVSKEFANAVVPTVLAFGKITGPGATNVIPDEVKIEGTFRTMDEKWRFEAHNRLRNTITLFSKNSGIDIELEIRIGYPCLINNEEVTRSSISAASEYLGEANVVPLGIWMASEDFAFYSQKVPACFYRIGTGNPEKNIVSPVHTATFSVDEDALEISSGLMAWITLQLMRKQEG
ncbi:MAG: M20 family metallopeptidase [Chitinophagales bacterium]